MKRWLMIFTAVLAILLVSGCSNNAASDNGNSGGDYIADAFVEGWWQCEQFKEGNATIDKIWIKYTAEKIVTECFMKTSGIIINISENLNPTAFYYNWDTMKKYADTNAERFIPVAEANVPGGAGWYKMKWEIHPTPDTTKIIELYLLYDRIGKLSRIGTVEKETSIDTITNDYGTDADILKNYNYRLMFQFWKLKYLKKITDYTQLPSWAQ